MCAALAHPFPPLYSEDSRILILGSFPSVKSREQKFFYGHPQNRFWSVIAAILSCPVPQSVAEKRTLLLSHGIALWDAVSRCEIEGSSDASIRNVVPNDLSEITNAADISQIFCNGKKSWDLYHRFIEPGTAREAICLPSTSPANASWTLDMLVAAWHEKIAPFLSADI